MKEMKWIELFIAAFIEKFHFSYCGVIGYRFSAQ